MRKAMSVLAWLGLAAAIVMLISQMGQKNDLRQETQTARRKNEVLQALYDQGKAEWQEKNKTLAEENDALTADVEALTEENEGLKQEIKALNEALAAAQKEAQAYADAEKQAAEALAQAQTEWDAQRQALTEEKEAASGRLSDVLAFLLTPAPEADIPAEEDGPENDLFQQATEAPEETAAPHHPLELLFPNR